MTTKLEKTLKRCRVFELQAKHGKGRKRKSSVPFPDLKVQSNYALSDTISVNGLKKDPSAHKWKTGLAESPETVREIEAKSKRISIQSNKGAYQYLTPGTDPKTIGRK